jgi:hypothetical protein
MVHLQNMGFAAPSRTMTPHHKEEKLHKKNINQPQLIFVRKKRESREGREKKKKKKKKKKKEEKEEDVSWCRGSAGWPSRPTAWVSPAVGLAPVSPFFFVFSDGSGDFRMTKSQKG